MRHAKHNDASTGLRASLRPLTDDRGKRVRGITRRDIVRAQKEGTPELRSLANRLRCAVRSESRRVTPDRVTVSVVLTVMIFIAQAVLIGVLTGGFGLFYPGLGLLAFVLLVAVAHAALLRYIKLGTRRQIVRTALAEGVCGSCAFSLRGAPVADDGCLTCPECGAAWRADLIVEPYWERPAPQRLRRSFLAWLTPGVLPIKLLYTPDDRGRFVQTPDARLMRVPRERRNEIDPAERRRLRRSARRVGMIARSLLTVLLLVIPGAFAYAAHGFWRDGEPYGMWFMIVLGAMVGVPILMLPATAALCGTHRTARRFVRLGRCGTCLRPLADAPSDGQGRRICPECSSVWVFDGSASPIVPAAAASPPIDGPPLVPDR